MKLDPELRQTSPLAFALVLVMCCVWCDSFYLVAPVLVGQMGDEWHYSASQLGMVVSAQSLGSIAGNLLVALVVSGWPVRRLLAGGLCGMALGYALLASKLPPTLAIAVSALAGVGSGMVGSSALRFLGLGERATRNISLYMTCDNLSTVLLLTWVLPALGSARADIGLIALGTLSSLVVVRVFRRGEPAISSEHDDAGGRVNVRGVAFSFGAIFCLYLGVGVVWTFLEQRADAAHLSAETASRVLALGTLLSLPCSFIVPRVVDRGWRWSGGLVALLGCALCTGALALPQTAALNIGATLGFTVIWTAAAMLQFSCVSAYDQRGRCIALAPAVLAGGSSIGATLGGLVIDQAGAAAAFAAAAACCVLAAACHAALRRVPALPPHEPELVSPPVNTHQDDPANPTPDVVRL